MLQLVYTDTITEVSMKGCVCTQTLQSFEVKVSKEKERKKLKKKLIQNLETIKHPPIYLPMTERTYLVFDKGIAGRKRYCLLVPVILCRIYWHYWNLVTLLNCCIAFLRCVGDSTTLNLGNRIGLI